MTAVHSILFCPWNLATSSTELSTYLPQKEKKTYNFSQARPRQHSYVRHVWPSVSTPIIIKGPFPLVRPVNIVRECYWVSSTWPSITSGKTNMPLTLRIWWVHRNLHDGDAWGLCREIKMNETSRIVGDAHEREDTTLLGSTSNERGVPRLHHRQVQSRTSPPRSETIYK